MDKIQIAKEYIKNYALNSEQFLQDYLDNKINEAEKIGRIPAESLRSFKALSKGGKRLRGGLVALAYQAFGGKELEKVYDISTFIELFQAGVLVHDDFMDNDPVRRGIKTLHTEFAERAVELNIKQDHQRYGDSIAICVGDASFFMAWEKILNSNFDSDIKIKVGQIFAEYILRLVYGQELDVTISGAKDLNEEDLLNVIWIKSGEYTTLLPLLIGASLTGENKNSERMKALINYAKCLGWAFHIKDDLLGMFGNEEDMGKPLGSDLREGKNTLLMLYLSKNGTQDQINIQKKLLGNPNITSDDVILMQNILKDSGSYDYVLNLGLNYVKEGKSYIENITENLQFRDVFEGLLDYMMNREK